MYEVFKVNISSRHVVPVKYIVYSEGNRRLNLKILNIDYSTNPPFFRNPAQIPLYCTSTYCSCRFIDIVHTYICFMCEFE